MINHLQHKISLGSLHKYHPYFHFTALQWSQQSCRFCFKCNTMYTFSLLVFSGSIEAISLIRTFKKKPADESTTFSNKEKRERTCTLRKVVYGRIYSIHFNLMSSSTYYIQQVISTDIDGLKARFVQFGILF